MEYIVTAEEMKTYDNNTIRSFGVVGAVLMERAALSVCERIVSRLGAGGKKALILCGSGNNGGDGFAIARILHTKQFAVRVLFAGSVQKMSDECRMQYESVLKYGIEVVHAKQSTACLDEDCDCIVDALFGVSLNRPVGGIYAQLIERVNAMSGFKVAVDIPSGIDADTGLVMGVAFRADETVTFAFRKAGLLLGDGKEYCGTVICADIGITKESFCGEIPGQFSYQSCDISRIPPRKAVSHKGSYGKVLLIAGSREIGGACLLAAQSLYRSGCGYVRVLTEEANRNLLLSQLPEAVLSTYKEDVWEVSHIRAACDFATVLVVGPGLSKSRMAKSLVEHVLFHEHKPLVLDADAINMISEEPSLKEALKTYARSQPVILTPHLLELQRFSDIEIADFKRDLLNKGLELARQYRMILVAKDAATVVFDGREAKETMPSVYINQSGNDGLATAGSGDVLTGIIGGMLAKGMDAMESACMGVYLHGLCADEAVKNSSKSYLKAGDLAQQLQYFLE